MSSSFAAPKASRHIFRKAGCARARARVFEPVLHTPISQRWVKPAFCHATYSLSGAVASVTGRPSLSDNSRSQHRVLTSKTSG